METINTLIIGSSAAGLSCAAQLSKRNIPYKIIEKHGHIGHAWRNHYDRLHLHTHKSSSHLPFVKFPKGTPKYPSKIQVIEYLDNYAKTLGIEPSFNTPAIKIMRKEDYWVTETSNGTITSQNLIICTGNTNIPKNYRKEGLESFPGKILHSSQYKNGSEFKGQKVLVIGFGNSACEIAICLHEHGAKPSMSVRSPVNVIPRDILGIPVLQIGIWQSKLSPELSDKLNKPLLKLLIGDITRYGLKKLPYGPREQIIKYHRIPLLDVGTMDLIRKGQIKIFGDVLSVHKDIVQFEDNSEDHFDAIISAIGYEAGLANFIQIDDERKNDLEKSLKERQFAGKDNLYFCGFYVSPTGMLREVGIESGIIAEKIAGKAL